MIDLGVLGAGRLGAVDGSGGLHPAGAEWALRWWIGAEDRWHVPTVEAAVRQHQFEDTPVVETRVRVVGGDVVHHAYAVTGPGGATALVAEITNETPVPVAIALVVDGRDARADGAALVVGDHTVRLPRPPSQWVAPAAFVPLPHKATLRVALGRGVAPDPTELPDAERVAAGWRSQAGAGARWSLPEPTLEAATTAARGFLLLHAPDDLGERALVAEARRAVGQRDDRRLVVDEQRLSGGFDGSMAATGQALVALGPDGDPELDAVVAKAGHWIERKRRVRKHRKDPRRAGLLPAGPQPPILGASSMTYLDDWWSVAGLARAACLLEDDGQREAAVDAWRFARGLAADVDVSIGNVGFDAVPAGPDRPLDAGVVGLVVAAVLGAVDPEAPRPAATLDLVRAELTTETGAVTAGVLSDGWSPWLTALLAAVEIGLGDQRGLERLRALAAGGRGAWPELVDGRPRVDVALAEHHAAATAAFLLAARRVLVVERGPHLARPDRLVVLPVVPDEWLGQGLELHDAATDFGRFGFAVRWHGDRPALLWELAPTDPDRPFRLEAPGLDPAWSSTEPTGEALLAARTMAVTEDSFS
jgi:hypothetical protein